MCSSVVDISSDASDTDLLSSVIEIKSALQTSSQGLSICVLLLCIVI